MFIVLLGIGFGTVLGVYIARNIVVDEVKRSNDFGDSKAGFKDFAAKPKLKITCSRNYVSKYEYASMFIPGEEKEE